MAELCDEVVLLNFGKAIAKDATAAVLASEEVRSVYLGKSGAPASHFVEATTGEQ